MENNIIVPIIIIASGAAILILLDRFVELCLNVEKILSRIASIETKIDKMIKE